MANMHLTGIPEGQRRETGKRDNILRYRIQRIFGN